MENNTTSTMVYRASILERLVPGLVHGFSGHLAYDDLGAYGEAVDHLLKPIGGWESAPVLLAQPHLPKVWFMEGDAPPPHGVDHQGFALEFDGASSPFGLNALLTIRSADCVPVLAVDPRLGVYAALHAGWRGAAAGILPNLLEGWWARGGRPGDVVLAFGPSIGPCCFEVGRECVEGFDPAHLEGALNKQGAQPRIDLHRVLRNQARLAGVPDDRIQSIGHCTFCHREDGRAPLASYRRAQRAGEPTEGRNISFIGVLPTTS